MRLPPTNGDIGQLTLNISYFIPKHTLQLNVFEKSPCCIIRREKSVCSVNLNVFFKPEYILYLKGIEVEALFLNEGKDFVL